MKKIIHFMIVVSLILPCVSFGEEWPEVEATLSEDFLNETLANAFRGHPTVKSLRFEFRPLEREVYLDLLLNISFEQLLHPASKVEAYMPTRIQARVLPSVLNSGGLRIKLLELTISIQSDISGEATWYNLKINNSFSYFLNLFDVFLVETNLGDLIQDKIDLTAEEFARIQELTQSSIEVHPEAIRIKKDIKTAGDSILFKLKLNELFKGRAMDVSALKNPKLWALEPSLDHNQMEYLRHINDSAIQPQKVLYLAIGETVPDDPATPENEALHPVFKKVMEERRVKVEEFLRLR
ncbi:MAG TPA: hypothetical protein VJB34_08140 [Bdellovibrionota bacterium]|nr:hypothetical protein [Bdellovibrionota bacterium]